MPAMVTAEESLSSPNNDSPAPPSPAPADSRPNNKRKQQDDKGVGWYLKAPLRALRSIRNSYERGMTRCAATRGTGYLRGSAGGAPMMMPRNLAVRNHGAWANASEEDIRELMLASSLGLLRAANPGVPRSQSAAPAVGRIDEDREMEFDDDGVGTGGGTGVGQYYPRSRSCAVVLPSRNRVVDGGTASPSPARKAS